MKNLINQDQAQKIQVKFSQFEIFFNRPLSIYTTWKIGGKGECVIISNNSTELDEIVKFGSVENLPVTILGHGSNVLISDQGISGIIVINKSKNGEIIDNDSVEFEFFAGNNNNSIVEIAPRHTEKDNSVLNFSDLDYRENDLPGMEKKLVCFDSGIDISRAIAWSHKNNLTGLQWFAGIPGTVGGALFNNIHGGSKHFSDNFIAVESVENVLGQPKLIGLVGPSGAGKSTIIKELLKKYPETLEKLVTTTTREIRAGEKSGVDKNFISKGEFLEMKDKNMFFETEEIYGEYYGMEIGALEKLNEKGKVGIMDIDFQGAWNLKKHFKGDFMYIFILPPSMEVLEKRIIGRDGRDNPKIQKRLEKAKIELSHRYKSDYQLANYKLPKVVNEIGELIAGNSRVSRSFIFKKNMNFGYDQSILRTHKNLKVLRVWMGLNCGDVEKARFTANEWTKRKRIQPRVSCGSVYQSIPDRKSVV